MDLSIRRAARGVPPLSYRAGHVSKRREEEQVLSLPAISIRWLVDRRKTGDGDTRLPRSLVVQPGRDDD